MAGDEDAPRTRHSLKSNDFFTNWKHKLRENCHKRIQEDRNRLLWRLRSPHSHNHKTIIRSALQDIVSDELKKFNDKSVNNELASSDVGPAIDDELWEYNGMPTAFDGDCEEILLEMQRIFYEDLKREESNKQSAIRDWEDEEDEYLASAVFQHMQLNEKQVNMVVWCPICKQGELRQDSCFIYCSLCKLRLHRCDEVNLDLLRIQLGEAHAEHLRRGCRLKPEFCMETKFEMTALYITCSGCKTFEIVI
ncbi:hypothetical protein Leryth_016424 [Lithospermum erythrorhizon]|nr:hypothetical protein Leryth_016424 [Lithospermum erythrorhizon]